MKSVNLLSVGVFVALGCIGCRNASPAKVSEVPVKDTVMVRVAPPEEKIEQLSISYRLLAVDSNKEWISTLSAGDTLNALLVLNRVDKKHLLRQDTLVVPDTFAADLNVYAPFPDSIATLKPINKIIFASYYAQAFAAYEHGIRVRWGPVSLGKKSTPTDTGLYYTNWKSQKTTSTVDRSWVMEWYFNIDNYGGVSMHEYALPGYPASHACMRLYRADAYWIYHWADQWLLKKNTQLAAYGTPVLIFGSYPFDGRKPWLSLNEDSTALQVTAEDISQLVAPSLQLILKRQTQRDTVLLCRK